MRYLGIDYGEKRVGTAISDEAGTLAFPLNVLENSESLFGMLTKICQENNIGFIVVGESKDFNQKDNAIMKDIRPFVENLKEKTSLPVEFHPEFLSSHQAERFQGKTDLLDASAAAVILQSFLDTKNSLKNNDRA